MMYEEQDKLVKKICVLTLATGPYRRFLPGLVESMKNYLLPGWDVTLHVYTDEPVQVTSDFPGVVAHEIEHRPSKRWWPTLDRFHLFVSTALQISMYDNYIYVDSDTLFTDYVGTEILGPRVYVQHCGFVGRYGTYETNRNSSCYVNDSWQDRWDALQVKLTEETGVRAKSRLRKAEKTLSSECPTYVAGSIWSFEHREFWRFMDLATEMVDRDFLNRIVPVWADESVINRYAIDNPATTMLSPGYHYPESQAIIEEQWAPRGLNYQCRILQLDKSKRMNDE